MPTPPRRLAALTTALLFSALGHANAATASTPNLDALLAQAGLSEIADCQDFADREALAERQRQWRRAIDKLGQSHPALLDAWIIGQQRPPKRAIEEASLQRDCLVLAMLQDAASEAHPNLRLDLSPDYAPTRKGMTQAAKRYGASPKARAHLGQRMTQSHVRDAASQAAIWRRKLVFDTRNFNRVSAHAAKRCGLHEGQSWRPGQSAHRRCWTQTLTAPERQREILMASSAPGISRHHWGSEFDLFDLNPARFERGGTHRALYVWMQQNALDHGFFQPFTGPTPEQPHTYIEERWHWSYYPIAHALAGHIKQHDARVVASLNAQWDSLEARWSAKGKPAEDCFSLVRARWRDYMIKVAAVSVQERAARHTTEHKP